MTRILFVFIVITLLSSPVSSQESYDHGTPNQNGLIDYGNGVYYISMDSKIESHHFDKVKPQKKPFGERLSELVFNHSQEKMITMIPYQEIGYTQGYYIIFKA